VLASTNLVGASTVGVVRSTNFVGARTVGVVESTKFVVESTVFVVASAVGVVWSTNLVGASTVGVVASTVFVLRSTNFVVESTNFAQLDSSRHERCYRLLAWRAPRGAVARAEQMMAECENTLTVFKVNLLPALITIRSTGLELDLSTRRGSGSAKSER
jgi:hypothetical protein